MTISENIESKRVFFGIPIPKEISTRIQMLRTLIPNSDNYIRWVSGKRLHMTLLFLGNLTDSSIHQLKSSLKSLNLINRFEVCIVDTGVFPDPNKPRVFWMDIGEGRDSLQELQSEIEKLAYDFKENKDDHVFVPHITIGRTSRRSKLWKIDATDFLNASYDPLIFMVDKFYLYQSELFPEGPKYTILEEYNLSVG